MAGMIFWACVLAYLITKGVEDGAWAIRGKESPRRQRCARDEARHGPRPGTRIKQAGAGYLAGLFEDATKWAYGAQRRWGAARREKDAHGPVLVDFNPAERGYRAVCDRCGWISRRYALQGEADRAAADHAKIHDDAGSDDDSDPTNTSRGSGDDGERTPEPNAGASNHRPDPGTHQRTDGDEPSTPIPPQSDPQPTGDSPATQHGTHIRRCPKCDWARQFRDTATADAALAAHRGTHKPDPTPDPGEAPTLGWCCPRCGDRREGYTTAAQCREAGEAHTCAVWDCPRCGAHGTGFATKAAAQAAGNAHTCPITPPPATRPGTPPGGNTVNFEAQGPDGIRAALAACVSQAEEDAADVRTIDTQAEEPTENIRTHQATALEASENAEQSAAALSAAIETFEADQMHPETLDIFRDVEAAYQQAAAELAEAADQFNTALEALEAAREHCQKAISDLGNAQEAAEDTLDHFNGHDGQVGDAVEETGNLAGQSVLVS